MSFTKVPLTDFDKLPFRVRRYIKSCLEPISHVDFQLNDTTLHDQYRIHFTNKRDPTVFIVNRIRIGDTNVVSREKYKDLPENIKNKITQDTLSILEHTNLKGEPWLYSISFEEPRTRTIYVHSMFVCDFLNQEDKVCFCGNFIY